MNRLVVILAFLVPGLAFAKEYVHDDHIHKTAEAVEECRAIKAKGFSIQHTPSGVPSALIGGKILPTNKRVKVLAHTSNSYPSGFSAEYLDPVSAPSVVEESGALRLSDTHWDYELTEYGQVLSPNGDGIAESASLYGTLVIRAIGGAKYQGPMGTLPFVYGTRTFYSIDGKPSGVRYEGTGMPPFTFLDGIEVTIPNFNIGYIDARNSLGEPLDEGLHVFNARISFYRTTPECDGSAEPLACRGALELGSATVQAPFRVDLSGPTLAMINPSPSSVTTTTPFLSFAWDDPSGVDTQSFSLSMPKTYLSAYQFNVYSFGATYQVLQWDALPEGFLIVNASIQDRVGNKTNISNAIKTLSTDTLSKIATVEDFLEENINLFGLVSPADQLTVDYRASSHSALMRTIQGMEMTYEMTTIIMRQVVEGIPVYRRGMAFALDANGAITGAYGEIETTVTSVPNPIRLDEKDARSVIFNRYPSARIGALRKFVVMPSDVTSISMPRAAWRATASHRIVWVDATTSEILQDEYGDLHDCPKPGGGFQCAYGWSESSIFSSTTSYITYEHLITTLWDVDSNSARSLVGKAFGSKIEVVVDDPTAYPLPTGQPLESGYWNFPANPPSLDMSAYGKDIVKMGAFTTYYYLEQSMSFLDNLNSSIDVVTTDVSTDPVTIVDPEIIIELNTPEVCDAHVGQDFHMYFYVGNLDCWPSMTNGPAIAHEAGHLFLFGKNVLPSTQFEASFHEGFADFFSYLVVGNPELVRGVVKDREHIAQRNLQAPKMTYAFDNVTTNIAGVGDITLGIFPDCSTPPCKVTFQTVLGVKVDQHYAGELLGGLLYSVNNRLNSKANWIGGLEGQQVESDFFKQVFVDSAAVVGASKLSSWNDYLTSLVAVFAGGSNNTTYIYDVLADFASAGIANNFNKQMSIQKIQTVQPIVATVDTFRTFSEAPTLRVFSGQAGSARVIAAWDSVSLNALEESIRTGGDASNLCSSGTCTDTGWFVVDGHVRSFPYYESSVDCVAAPDDCLTYHWKIITLDTTFWEASVPSSGLRPIFVRALSKDNTDGITSSKLSTFGDYELRASRTDAAGIASAYICIAVYSYDVLISVFGPFIPIIHLGCSVTPKGPELYVYQAEGCNPGPTPPRCTVQPQSDFFTPGRYLPLVLIALFFGWLLVLAQLKRDDSSKDHRKKNEPLRRSKR